MRFGAPPLLHHPVFREQRNSLRGMGFEPMRFATTDLETVSLTTRTSSFLQASSYNRKLLLCLLYEAFLHSAGIGPASTEWKSVILPLNYECYVTCVTYSDTGSRTRAKAVKEPYPNR